MLTVGIFQVKIRASVVGGPCWGLVVEVSFGAC